VLLLLVWYGDVRFSALTVKRSSAVIGNLALKWATGEVPEGNLKDDDLKIGDLDRARCRPTASTR
jgi:hypothetical protein